MNLLLSSSSRSWLTRLLLPPLSSASIITHFWPLIWFKIDTFISRGGQCTGKGERWERGGVTGLSKLTDNGRIIIIVNNDIRPGTRPESLCCYETEEEESPPQLGHLSFSLPIPPIWNALHSIDRSSCTGSVSHLMVRYLTPWSRSNQYEILNWMTMRVIDEWQSGKERRKRTAKE